MAKKHRTADLVAPVHALPSTEAFFDRQSILAHRPPHIPSLRSGSRPPAPVPEHSRPDVGSSLTVPSPLSQPCLEEDDEQRPSLAVKSPRPPGAPQRLDAPGSQLHAPSSAHPSITMPGAPAASSSSRKGTHSTDPRGSPTMPASVPQAAALTWQAGQSLDTAMSGGLRAHMRSLLGEANATRMAGASHSAAPGAAAPVRRAAASEGDITVLAVLARSSETAFPSSCPRPILASATHAADRMVSAAHVKATAATQPPTDQREGPQGLQADTIREAVVAVAQKCSMLARIPSTRSASESRGPNLIAVLAGKEDEPHPADVKPLPAHEEPISSGQAEQPQVASAGVGRAWQHGSASTSPAPRKLRRWTMIMVPALSCKGLMSKTSMPPCISECMHGRSFTPSAIPS